MNIPARRTFLALTVLVPALLSLAGCTTAPPPVHSMQDPQANFSGFKTFAWDEKGKNGEAPQPVSILDGNIRSAISTQLQQKGYAEASAGSAPDLVLHYETAAAEKIKANPVRIGVGMGGYGSNGAAGVGVSSAAAKNVREGTLVLRMIDPVRNAEVWNGSVSRELGKGGAPDQALINSAVADLLKDLPAH